MDATEFLSTIWRSFPSVNDLTSFQFGAIEAIWIDAIWVGGIAATPIALVAAMFCSSKRVRPATRHALALAALVSFLTPAIAGAFWRPDFLKLAPVPPIGVAANTTVAIPPPPREALAVPSASLAHECDATINASLAGASRFPVVPVTMSTDEAPACRATSTIASSNASVKVALPSVAAPTLSQPAKTLAANGPARQQSGPWLPRFIALRDTIADLPPLPPLIGLAGAAIFIAHHIARIVRARRSFAGATAAPSAVVLDVADASKALGLANPPATFVTDARISPMVLCGFTPRLIIPSELWRELDADSRRAVLVHELAHLRRGDHRWCWLETLVLAIYWWHPLVWWLRRRLRDDAELCCDAWVTQLLPRSRRAYAEALVAATEFVAHTQRGRAQPAPAYAFVGLGVVATTRNSQRLATQRLTRRITMVMTDRTAPRVSMVGAFVVAAALGVGAFVTPGLACPPEELAQRQVQNSQAQARVRVVPPRSAGRDRAPTQAGASVDFMGEAPAIEAMQGQGQGQGAMAQAQEELLAAALGQSRSWGSANPSQDSQEVVLRAYYLPEGKLEALTELMSRQDVPVFIDANDDHIVVHATPAQHEVFELFIRLIHPEAAGSQSPGAATMPRSGSAGGPAQWRGQRFPNPAFGQRPPMSRSTANEYRSALRQLELSRADVERQAEQMREAAEAAEERSVDVRAAMEALTDQARGTNDQIAAQALQQAVHALAERDAALAADASRKSMHASDLEMRLQQIEAQLAETGARLEALSAMLDATTELSDDAESPEPIEAPEPAESPEPVAAPAAAASSFVLAGPATDPLLARALVAPAASSPLRGTLRGATAPLAPLAPIAPAPPR
ncbi:MAG: M56 family metallopeptidase [Phycisphaerae bacterium]|nr:M56 family metallopeptidase [Phycisphaerae bacterium]